MDRIFFVAACFFFIPSLARTEAISSATAPSVNSSSAPFTNAKRLCDLNRDGVCDQKDRDIFESMLGKCCHEVRANTYDCAEVTGSDAHEFPDFDGDLCVTEKDRPLFEQVWNAEQHPIH